ncbi:MAG: hypothetical protein WDZ41_00990 [Candidatus Babeliales bacterium]
MKKLIIVLIFLVHSLVICSIKSDKETVLPTLVVEKIPSDCILLDEIIAVAHGPERSQIFCKSDQERRGIDSRQRTLGDLIGDELIYQDALKFKLPIDDTIVKDHLRRTLQAFGLKPGDEQSIFAQEGYSYDEGFNQFRIMYGVNTMIDQRVRSALLVPEDDVIAYYNENPVIKEPVYFLQTAFLSLEREKGKKMKGLEKDIERFIKTGKGVDVMWSDPYWLKESEIAEGLDFITQMQENTIEKQRVAGGYQLYQLKQKKPQRAVPLKKRYKQIVETLRKPKFVKNLEKYKKSLFDAATIIYL